MDILIESMNSHYKGTVSSLDPRLAKAQESNLLSYLAFMTALIEIENQESEAGKVFAKKFLSWRSTVKGIEKLMGRIEILNSERELEVVYFNIPQIVRNHWSDHFVSQYRENMILEVKRDNPEEKVKDFL